MWSEHMHIIEKKKKTWHTLAHLVALSLYLKASLMTNFSKKKGGPNNLEIATEW